MTILLTDPQRAIKALRRIAKNSDVTDMDPRLLAELRIGKLIYTASNEHTGRVHAHLKEKGRDALERTHP